MRVSVASVVALLVLSAFPLAQTPPAKTPPPKPAAAPPAPDTPTFRTGVDVVTVEVGVADKTGRPVRDLTAGDFIVKVDGKPRRIVSARHVAFDVAAVKRAAANSEETYFTTNISPPGGRLIMLAVDQTNIRAGAVRPLLNTAAKFLDRLSPLDQVAFAVYPPPGPEIGFTTDRTRIKQAMQQVVGNQQQFHGKFNIGLSEAIAIHEHQDETTLRIVVQRECGAKPKNAQQFQDTCPREVEADAAERVQFARREASISLNGLQNLLTRMAFIDGQKSLILLSEGLIVDDGTRELEDIARLAAMARASVNIMLMDVSRVDLTQAQLPPTPSQDRALEVKGLEDMAAQARGMLVQVIGTGESAFERLASELTGFYILGVEESPSDRQGKNHRLDVSLRRKGLILRSNQAFVLSSSMRAGRSPEDSLVEALNTPFAVAELPMRVSNFSFQEPGNAEKVRVILPIEVGQAGAPAAEFTLGYVMFDSQGRVAASGNDRKRLTPVDGREDVPLAYVISASVDPGSYVLRFGAVDDQGRRGSVVRDVHAWKISGEEFAVGDLLLGNMPSTNELVQPQVEPRIYDNRLVTYVELYGSNDAALGAAAVSVEIAEDEDGPALTAVAVPLGKVARATTRVAQGSVNMEILPPGRYVARARITREGKPAGVLVRPFILTPSAAMGKANMPAHLTSWVPKFDRDAALKPGVMSPMLDMVQRSAASIGDAMTEARAGRFGPAALEALTAGDQTTAMFLRGLDFLLKGQLNEAAVQFNNASGARREFFPAAFYLGVCYAAAGNDRDAAGVWQLAMLGDPKPGPVYSLFADARLRTNQPSSVIDVLAPAWRRDPDNDDMAKRLAIAYVMTGRYVEAIPVLDAYLSRHAADQEALYAAVMAQYQESAKAKTPLSNVVLAKLTKYSRAYTGPDKALLSKYLASLEAR